jgi:hypothetical protein
MPRMTANQLQQFCLRLDQIPELAGAGVGYVGDNMCQVYRPSRHSSGLTTFVIIKEEEVTKQAATAKAQTPQVNLTTELVGLGLNCAGAALVGIAFASSAAAAPLSGGTSIPLSYVIAGAGIATFIQCINSIGRIVAVGANASDWVAKLDSESWYNWTQAVLDSISLLGTAASVRGTVKAVFAIRSSTNKSWREILKGLNSAERKKLTKELIRMQKPGISNSKMKDLIRAGEFPTRYSAAEIRQSILVQLREALDSTLTLASSVMSGNVRFFYVSVFQE